MFAELERSAEAAPSTEMWRAYLFSRGIFLPERQPPGLALDEREAA
jgi:hypothetical protein